MNTDQLVWILLIAAIAAFAVIWLAPRLLGSEVNRLGNLIYSDNRQAKTLYDNVNRVHGRPDFIVQTRIPFFSEARPVEFKTGRPPKSPHAGHVLQLAAEGLLVEANFGKYPRVGYVFYKHSDSNSKAMFKVRLGRRARAAALQVTDAIRDGNCHPTKVKVDARCGGCFARARCPFVAA